MSKEASEREHIQLLLKVARLYHEDGLSQAEVADRIGYSRPTICRLLNEARERGIVKVIVSHPIEQCFETERRLRRTFGLRHAYVVAPEDAGAEHRRVGELAASAVADLGSGGSVLALSNGRSLAAMVEAMPPQRWYRSCVVQMIGSLGQTSTSLIDSPDLCRRLADRLGGASRPLPVPMVVRSKGVAESVRREESVLTTIEMAARSDLALVGVGAVNPRGQSGDILRGFSDPRVEQEIHARGAVAHLCGHHFDARGRHLYTSLCERTVGLPPERLRNTGLVVAIAWGVEKVPAIMASLRSELISCLITTEHTAELLLAEQQAAR